MTSGSDRGRSIKDDLKAALCDPDVLELVSKAVAAQVFSQQRKEIAGLNSNSKTLFYKDCSLGSVKLGSVKILSNN